MKKYFTVNIPSTTKLKIPSASYCLFSIESRMNLSKTPVKEIRAADAAEHAKPATMGRRCS